MNARRAMIAGDSIGELLMTRLVSGAIGIAVFAAVAASMGVSAQQNQMSFFITGRISVDSPVPIRSVKHSQQPPELGTARGARI